MWIWHASMRIAPPNPQYRFRMPQKLGFSALSVAVDQSLEGDGLDRLVYFAGIGTSWKPSVAAFRAIEFTSLAFI